MSTLKVDQIKNIVESSVVDVSDIASKNAFGADTGASLVGFKANGVGAVATTVQAKLRESVSVKDFGAVGDGVTDDTAAIQAAIDYAYGRGGGSVMVPNGTFKISATIVVKENVTLVGESRFGSELSGITNTFTGMLLNSPAAAIHSLTVRDCDVGIKMGGVEGSIPHDGHYGDVYFCHIAYNRIGIDSWDAYMTSIHGNKIVFNGYGIIIRGQSYAMNVYDNEIGNCLRGVGVYISGSSGCIIRDNGIEGCRNIYTNDGGLGLMITSSQRTIIEGNWFETNHAPGSIENGVDVMIGNPTDPVTTALIANCIPTEYQAEATGLSTGIYGPIHFSGNFHYVTKHGYFINSTMYFGSVTIENPTFVGAKGRFNKAIRIKGGAAGCNIALRRLQVLNTADNTISDEMNTGIKNTCVFVEGTMPVYGALTLDGEDLLTARLTKDTFLALSGATLNVTARRPTGGTATLKTGVLRTVGGNAGFYTKKGTDRVRLQNAGVFTLNTPMVMALLCKNIHGEAEAAGFVYYGTGGPAGVSAMDSNGFTKLISLTATTDAEGYVSSGEYYGMLLMTKAAFDASSLRGCVRLVVDGLDVVSTNQYATTSPTAFSSAAAYVWAVGDTVYNSNPVAGGYVGWICTAAGSPGTWKGFGAIEV